MKADLNSRMSVTMQDVPIEKVFYCHTNWAQKLRDQNQHSMNMDASMNVKENIHEQIRSFNDYDVILIPFFPDSAAP